MTTSTLLLRRGLGLLLLLLLVLLALGARAQAPAVRVTVVPLPPYSTHLSDYADEPNRLLVTLSNTTRSPLSVQLAANLTGDNGIRVQTRPDARSPRPIALDPLQTRQLDRDELGQLLDANMLSYSGVRLEEIVRGNGLPEGTYTLCVRALDYTTGRLLSAEEPVGCSRPFALRSLEPPYVIRPLPDEVVPSRSPQNILFTWSRPAGAAVTTEFELRIVELSNNDRNINDAFLSGTVPPLFERVVTGAPTLLYGPAEPALIVGRRYAFAVTARDPQGRQVFRNNGRSEVQSFVYGGAAATTPAPAGPVASGPGKVVKTPIKITTALLPSVTVRGRLLWGWHQSEEKISNYPLTAASGLNGQGQAWVALNDPSAGGAAQAALVAALHEANATGGAASSQSSAGGAGKASVGNSGSATSNGGGSTSSGGNSSSAGYSNPVSAVVGSTTSGVVGQLLDHATVVNGGGAATSFGVGPATTIPGLAGGASSANTPIQIGDGNSGLYLPYVLGKQRYPLAGQKVKLIFEYKKIPHGQPGWDDPLLNPQHTEVVGVGTVADDGSYAINVLTTPPGVGSSGSGYPDFWSGTKVYGMSRMRVAIADPHFFNEPGSYALKASGDGSYDLGDTPVLAKTYRLKTEVVDGAGNPATGVTVQLTRSQLWYTSHDYARHEGTEPDDNRQVLSNLAQPGKKGSGPGNLSPSAGILSSVVVAVSNGKGALARLFSNGGGSLDAYGVRITGEGYNPTTTSFSALPATSSCTDGVVTITQKFKVVGQSPRVRGRVLRQNDNSPVAGATVRLARTDGGAGQVFTTQTDALGAFVLAMPGPTNTPMTLKVLKGPAVGKEWREDNLDMDHTGPAGILTRDPILIEAVLHPVAGRVVSDDAGNPGVAAAYLRWKSGGVPFQADDEGRFTSLHQSGPDTLYISKLGFKELRVGVTIIGGGLFSGGSVGGKVGKKNSGAGGPAYVLTGPNATSQSQQAGYQAVQTVLANAHSLQVAGAAPYQGNSGSGGGGSNGGGSVLSPGFVVGANIGKVSTSLNSNAVVGALVGDLSDNVPLGDGQDLGTFTLARLVGHLQVTVLDSASGKPLAGATVQFPDTDPLLSQPTGPDGSIYFGKAPGGPVSVQVSGPAGGSTTYVPALLDLSVAVDGSTTKLTVKLAPGTRVQGKVLAGGQPVPAATVRVVGRPDLTTQTGSDGKYQLLGVPKGSWALEASKAGLVGQSITQKFVPGQNATVDFALTNAGFAIDKLLGFSIEVKSLKAGTDTTLTGAFINLPDNPAFKVKAGTRLEFANVAVRVGKNGVLRPKGQPYVLTDATELPLTAFGFLPVKATASAGLRVQMLGTDPTKGAVAGTIEVNFDALGQAGKALGWAWQNGAKTYLSEASGTGEVPALPVLFAGGPPSYDTKQLKLRSTVQTVGLALYGFSATVDLQKSTVGSDGLHLAGSVGLGGVPGLGDTKIGVSNLWIDTGGSIKTAVLALDPPLSVSVLGFGLKLSGGALTEVGFKLSGSASVNLPSSAASTLTFKELSISKSQLYGGTFYLPAQGLDVFGLAKFKAVQGVPLSFGTVPGTSVGFFSGGATTSLSLINKSITIKQFTIRSDGKFSADVPTDLSAEFAGLAKLSITDIKFTTIGGVGIDVASNVQLHLPLVQAEAGNIRYRPGKSPSLEKLGLHVQLPVGQLGGSVSFLDNGFAGDFSLNVVDVVQASASLRYEKHPSGFYFKADIKAGIPPVPIGPALFLNGVLGGVTFENSQLHDVTLGGVITIAGIEQGAKLDPLAVTVSAGPVIFGDAVLKVADQKVAEATVTLDFPQALATVQLKTNYNPLPAISSATAGAMLQLCGQSGNTYWVMGVMAQMSVAGIANVNANVLVGQNFNITKHPEFTPYTSFLDAKYLSGGTTVNGAHFLCATNIGRTQNNPWHACFWKACGDIWIYSNSSTGYNLNFANGAFGLHLANAWGGGANLTICGKSIAGADVGASGDLDGGYNPSQGWNLKGDLSGHVAGWLGDCTNACKNKICWGGCFNACFVGCRVCPIPEGIKVCVGATLSVSYGSNSGFDVGLDL